MPARDDETRIKPADDDASFAKTDPPRARDDATRVKAAEEDPSLLDTFPPRGRSQADETRLAPAPERPARRTSEPLPEEQATKLQPAPSRRSPRAEVGEGGRGGEASAVGPMDPEAKRRLTIAASCAGAVVGAILLWGLYTALQDRPVPEQLAELYPYGYGGARGPRGEKAPGAPYVDFELVGSEDCPAGHSTCLRYRYSRDAFEGTMVVGRTLGGAWVRLGDQGMPFRPVDAWR